MPVAPQEYWYSGGWEPSQNPFVSEPVWPYYGLWISDFSRQIILPVSSPWTKFIFASANTTVVGTRSPCVMFDGYGGQSAILTTAGTPEFPVFGDVSAPSYYFQLLPGTFSGPGGSAYSQQLYVLATQNSFPITVVSDAGTVNGLSSYLMPGATAGGLTVLVCQYDQVSNWTTTLASPASLSSFSLV